MNILVTGSDGYIGSLLTTVLIDQGYNVTGLDTGYYREGSLYDSSNVIYKTIRKDIRNLKAEDLNGYDVVIHMAELSNDPTASNPLKNPDNPIRVDKIAISTHNSTMSFSEIIS